MCTRTYTMNNIWIIQNIIYCHTSVDDQLPSKSEEKNVQESDASLNIESIISVSCYHRNISTSYLVFKVSPKNYVHKHPKYTHYLKRLNNYYRSQKEKCINLDRLFKFVVFSEEIRYTHSKFEVLAKETNSGYDIDKNDAGNRGLSVIHAQSVRLHTHTHTRTITHSIFRANCAFLNLIQK